MNRCCLGIADREDSELSRFWMDAGSPKPIRLEGFARVGKTELAKLLVKLVGKEHVAGDHFVCKFDVPPS
jgi:hypothetical protein